MNYEETLELEVGQSTPHRRRDGWSRGAFDFESPAFSTTYNQQVEFGTGMGGPEVAFIFMDTQMLNDLMDDKTFPRGANSWMRIEVRKRRKTQKRMEQAGVGEINLGSFDLAFLQILVPGLKGTLP